MTSSWLDSLRVYRHPRVVAMLFLGFSAGLPLLLVFGTLSAWLREAGIDRSTIGFVSWVASLYAFKFVWAPLVDRLPLPALTARLGQRRGWMLAAQLLVVAGLLVMAQSVPQAQLHTLIGGALLVAFASATQDVAVDAWRIEAVEDERQGAMAAAYQTGYRIALLVAGAGALYLAEYFDWKVSYLAMAVFGLVGVVTTVLIGEPEHTLDRRTYLNEARVVSFLDNSAHLRPALRQAAAWFIGAVVCPVSEFLTRHGAFALAVLAFIGLYRLTDNVLGVMANPFYLDLGYSKADIASVSKLYGLVMTLAGAALGGGLIVRFGVMRMLFVTGVLAAATNLLFWWLAGQSPDIGPELWRLILVISADNLASGMAGSVFIAYLSSLTNRAYTATQYALFSSLMLLPGRLLGGFSGVFVDTAGYEWFFIATALLGIPALLLIPVLARAQGPRNA
jgi:PAT family beta-lactamase induction signal transducer AmpG